VLSVALALGAALCYAAASVLQQRAAAAEPAEHSLRLGLLTRLARRPLWLAGIVADVAGFGLQFAALAEGTLVVVQPLLVVGLLFALPAEARLAGARIKARDLAAAGAVCVGLAVFLTVSNPAVGVAVAGPAVWPVVLGAGCGGAVVLAALGRRAGGRAKAVLLSAAAGVTYGVAAGLLKTTASYLALGVVSTLGHWQLYALVVVGLGGMLLGASAFQAGRLDVSLPTMSVLDPLVSVLVGALGFQESISVSAPAVTAELAGLAVAAAGLFVLARSPVVRHTPHPEPS
jgi:drug/metabolite transporter (DMT)-like permease